MIKRSGSIIGLTIVLLRAHAVAQPRNPTLDDRIRAQTAIERVYWSHRIWPRENAGPKPSLEAVLDEVVIRSKVDDYLRQSKALEVLWKRPILPEQLQAEVERMVRGTQQPGVLRELFAALNDDPLLIAECLARPILADRLMHASYSWDRTLHSRPRLLAESVLKRGSGIGSLRRLVGSNGYSETIYRPQGVNAGRFDHDEPLLTIDLAPEEWRTLLQDLAMQLGANWLPEPRRVEPRSTMLRACPDGVPDLDNVRFPLGRLSKLQEDDDGFYVREVISQDSATLRTATLRWSKTPLDIWWKAEKQRFEPTLDVPQVSYRLPALPSGVCQDDTWTPTRPEVVPDPRERQATVWTGSEMIVWGGSNGLSLNSGGRYDPATDTWTPIGLVGSVPSARADATAVWTGSEMLIWGGADYSTPAPTYFNSGGLYDPSADQWRATSTAGAVPSPRAGHSAVWTGSEMIVWGGTNNTGPDLNSGGRYNPDNDTWQSTSTGPNVPAPRDHHTGIWTGSEMIVWGGYVATSPPVFLGSGGRYNPSTNSWAPVSNGIDTPSPRTSHSAIWTGSRMIVWGGEGDSGYVRTGALYDPPNDTWSPTSLAPDTPSARGGQAAVWTGSLMIVWGGYDGSEEPYPTTGGLYDPGSNGWTSTHVDQSTAPGGRVRFSAVWTGSEMIVWGGSSFFHKSDGARYDPLFRTWTPTSSGSNVPLARSSHSVVWTGSEMIVWGGHNGSYLRSGGRYSPATDTWVHTAEGLTVPRSRAGHSAVWTGREMIVWGGQRPTTLNSGGRYDPQTDSWQPTQDIMGVPSARSLHTAVWTGREMVVWGGGSSTNSGGRYNPDTNSWAPTSTVGAPAGRVNHTAVWTGRDMVVWGGVGSSAYLNSGGRYVPSSNSWTPTSLGTNVPAPRQRHGAIWTGSEMIVWGGADAATSLATGGRYDPALNVWTPVSTGMNAPAPRFAHTTIWTGAEMIVWGGTSGSSPMNSGGRYDIVTDRWTPTSLDEAPTSRQDHVAVWAGREMIVWGGSPKTSSGSRYCAGSPCPVTIWFHDSDDDGYGNSTDSVLSCTQPSGYTATPGDCNDTDAGAWGVPGEVSDLGISKMVQGLRVSWHSLDESLGSGTTYDIPRGGLSILHANGFPAGASCTASGVADTPYDDSSSACPAIAGDGCWYLVRAHNPCGTGTYGAAGLDVSSPCP